MSTNKFKKLIDTKDYQKIIGLHTHLKINLTDRQLDRVLKLKKEKEGELWRKEHKQIGC